MPNDTTQQIKEKPVDTTKSKHVCPTCGSVLEQKMPFTKYFALLGGGIDMLFPQFWCNKCNKRISLNQLPQDAKKETRLMQLIGIGLIVIVIIIGYFLINNR